MLIWYLIELTRLGILNRDEIEIEIELFAEIETEIEIEILRGFEGLSALQRKLPCKEIIN